MLAVALLDSGFTVRTAASAAEALAEARKRPPSLVLTDIAMPEMDGFQLCAAFRGDPGLGRRAGRPAGRRPDRSAPARARHHGRRRRLPDQAGRPAPAGPGHSPASAA